MNLRLSNISQSPSGPTSHGIPALANAQPPAPSMLASAPPEERERAFVIGLNHFGSVLLGVLDELPPLPVKLQASKGERLIVEPDVMGPLKERIAELLEPGNPRVRMPEGEKKALRLIALGFKNSLGGELPFSPGHWANFLEFVQQNMPAGMKGFSAVTGFSDLAREVRQANQFDGDIDAFSKDEVVLLNPDFQALLLPSLDGRYFAADDWARFFARLVVLDGGGADPTPPDPTPPDPAPADPTPPGRRIRVPVDGPIRSIAGIDALPPAAPILSSLLDAARDLA